MRALKSKLSLLALCAGIAALGALVSPQEAQAEIPYGCGGYYPSANVAFSAGGYGGNHGGDYDGNHGGNHGGNYGGCATTPEDIDNSLRQVANDRVRSLITHNRLASPLLGGTEQINCGDCFRGFGMLGSFSVGFNGRKNLTDRLSVLGGLSYNEFDSKSAKTTGAPMLALGLRYDLADWGSSRPFFEVAGSLSPGERVRTLRVVNAGGAAGALIGSADATTWSASARAGWVHRMSPVAEFAAYVAYARTEQRFGSYTEKGDPTLLPLTYDARSASINVVKAVVQHTQLLSPMIEAHVSAGLAHGFGAKSGVQAVSALPFYGAFTPAAKDSTWAEFDARVGFRVAKGTVIDVFALTTVGPKPVGNSIHGGLGLRYLF